MLKGKSKENVDKKDEYKHTRTDENKENEKNQQNENAKSVAKEDNEEQKSLNENADKNENKNEETNTENKDTNLENIEEKSVTVNKEKSLEIAKLKKVIKEKKQMPKEERESAYKDLFKNIIMAIVVVLYFIFLNLGYINIKNDIYVVDLKVFGVCLLLIAIGFIENGYKKDNGMIALYGVELIFLAITTIGLIYVNLMMQPKIVYILPVISYVFSIYYLIKSTVIYKRRKRKYFINDIKDMMNKDE